MEYWQYSNTKAAEQADDQTVRPTGEEFLAILPQPLQKKLDQSHEHASCCGRAHSIENTTCMEGSAGYTHCNISNSTMLTAKTMLAAKAKTRHDS